MLKSSFIKIDVNFEAFVMIVTIIIHKSSTMQFYYIIRIMLVSVLTVALLLDSEF